MSILICICISCAYVGSLYRIPQRVRKLPRDDPTHIKYRLNAGMIVTIAIFIVSLLLVGGDTSQLGLQFDIMNTFTTVLSTTFLMIIFYLGPITTFVMFVSFSCHHKIRLNGDWTIRETPASVLSILQNLSASYIENYGSLILIRNLIFAPISEEIVFRACMITFLIQYYNNQEYEASTNLYVILTCPLLFMLAHVHHVYEKIRSGIPIKYAIISTLIQLSYTSIFGIMATILIMRTGNILSCILSHIICNTIGLPNVGFLWESESVDGANEYSFMYPYRFLLTILHILGLILFSFALFPITQSLAEKSVLWIS